MRYTIEPDPALAGRVLIKADGCSILTVSDDLSAHRVLVSCLQVGDVTPLPPDVRRGYRTATMHASARRQRDHKYKAPQKSLYAKDEMSSELPF